MTQENKYNKSEMFWPNRIALGERIINEKGRTETIYGIEEVSDNEKYVSTIDGEESNFKYLKTYLINNKGIERVCMKKTKLELILDLKENVPNILEEMEELSFIQLN